MPTQFTHYIELVFHIPSNVKKSKLKYPHYRPLNTLRHVSNVKLYKYNSNSKCSILIYQMLLFIYFEWIFPWKLFFFCFRPTAIRPVGARKPVFYSYILSHQLYFYPYFFLAIKQFQWCIKMLAHLLCYYYCFFFFFSFSFPSFGSLSISAFLSSYLASHSHWMR